MSQATIENQEAAAGVAVGNDPAGLSAKKLEYLERRLARTPKEFRPAFIRKAMASGLFYGYEEHIERLSK